MERFGWLEGGREKRGAFELALAVGLGVPRRMRGRRRRRRAGRRMGAVEVALGVDSINFKGHHHHSPVQQQLHGAGGAPSRSF